MSEKCLNLGVVGLGYWGPTLLRALMEVDGVEIGWVCDSDKSRLERSRRRYPAARATTRIDDLLADPKVDAVVLATPVFTHFYLASRALTAGKHVFVEKPLATSSAEADQLTRLAEMEGLVLMCGHTFVYSPPVRAVKELLDQEALGQIYFVSSSRVNLGLHQSDISVVWDLGPHDFSILRFWLEDLPAEVSAMTRCCVFPDVPDVAFVNMRFPGGTIAHLELSWLSPSKLRRTTVIGSSKMVVYDDTSTEPVRIFDSGASLPDPESFGEYRLTYRTGDIVSPRVEATEPLALEVADFCAAILDGTELRSSPAIGLDVVRSIEMVEDSLSVAGGSEAIPGVGRSSTPAGRLKP